MEKWCIFNIGVLWNSLHIFTKRKFTSKDVELHLEEWLFKNDLLPFSRLFPLYTQVFVLQNSVSNMLCGKCFFFPSACFLFYFFVASQDLFPLDYAK